MFLFCDYFFFERSWAGVHEVLDEAERVGFLHPGKRNTRRRSCQQLPNGRVQRKQSQAQWHIVEGQEAMDTSWNSGNWFLKPEGDQILKQPERLWKLPPWICPWATRYRSALHWAGVCTERLLTFAIESHWIGSHQLHLLNNAKYIRIKSYSSVSDEHIFSMCKLSVQEEISHLLFTQ